LIGNQKQHSWLSISAGLLTLMLTVGCSSSSNSTITGKVTLNGEPLDDAVIRFQPIGSGHSGGGQAEIQAGKYQTDGLSPGEYRVWIMAERKTGRKVRDLEAEAGQKPALVDQIVQIIPIQYNARTELKASVKAGENKCDFALTIRGKR